MSSTNKITISELEHIAKLSRLELKPEEEEKLANQLSETTSYIDVLQELDTQNVLPTSQVNNKKNVFRDDIIEPSLTQQQALSQASDTYNGYFKTSATISKK